MHAYIFVLQKLNKKCIEQSLKTPFLTGWVFLASPFPGWRSWNEQGEGAHANFF